MNAITFRPIREDADTVTLSRADFEALTEMLEDAADIEALLQAKAAIERGEDELIPLELSKAILTGKNPVLAFRGYRGLSQQTLAREAGISASYLSEIENGRKPGSLDAMIRLAGVLRVPLESLLPPRPSE